MEKTLVSSSTMEHYTGAFYMPSQSFELHSRISVTTAQNFDLMSRQVYLHADSLHSDDLVILYHTMTYHYPRVAGMVQGTREIKFSSTMVPDAW